MKLEQLQSLMPDGKVRAAAFLPGLNNAMTKFGIATPASRAAFIAQILHESKYLASMTENLNYSPAGIIATFNNRKVTRFTQDMATRYGRTAAHPANQQMIANVAYANRMGNGSIESGDGWRYRGRGPGQLTGKDNYRLCGAALGIDLISNPDQVAQPDVGCQAFAWFWARGNPTGKSLGLLADSGRFDQISKEVNGGAHGLVERRDLTVLAMKALA